jgi:hypothetical protein
MTTEALREAFSIALSDSFHPQSSQHMYAMGAFDRAVEETKDEWRKFDKDDNTTWPAMDEWVWLVAAEVTEGERVPVITKWAGVFTATVLPDAAFWMPIETPAVPS